MNKLKKVKLLEGIVCLGTVALMMFMVVFFFLFDKPAIEGYVPPEVSADSSLQFGHGLGKAFTLVFVIIAMMFMAGAALFLLIGGIGQLTQKKKEFSILFSALGMVGKVVAAAAFIFVTILMFGEGIVASVRPMHVIYSVLACASLAWSIIALVLACKWLPKKQKAAVVVVQEEGVEEIEELADTEYVHTED